MKFKVGDKVTFKHKLFTSERLERSKHPLFVLTQAPSTVESVYCDYPGDTRYILRAHTGNVVCIPAFEEELTAVDNVVVRHAFMVEVEQRSTDGKFRGVPYLNGKALPPTLWHSSARKALFWAMYLQCDDANCNLFPTVMPEVL